MNTAFTNKSYFACTQISILKWSVRVLIMTCIMNTDDRTSRLLKDRNATITKSVLDYGNNNYY